MIKEKIDTAIPQAFIKQQKKQVEVLDIDDAQRHSDEATLLLNS